MKTEIAIIYGDLTERRVAWEDRLRLVTTDVLHIALIIPGQAQRYQSSTFHDFYHLIWDDAETECCLTGHDDDFAWFSLTDPARNPVWRFPYDKPANLIEFVGVYVDNATYRTAVARDDDRDGIMY